MPNEVTPPAGDQSATPAAPAAPAAPVTLPATPATPEPVAPAAPAPAATEPPQFEKSGDPGLDLAIDFVAGLGVKPTDPEYLAAATGNFDLLRVKLATMGDKSKGYEAVLAVAEKAFKSLSESREAATKERNTLIETEAGGAEAWVAVRDWAKANADPEEITSINAMLNGDPLQVKMAVHYLKGVHAQANNVSNPPKPGFRDDAGGAPASGSQGPLEPKAYALAVAALAAKLGSKLEASPEYAELRRRRLAWQP